MSTFVKKATSAIAALAVVFSVVSPVAGVSAAYTSVEAANYLAQEGVIVNHSSNPAMYELGNNVLRREAVKVMMNLSSITQNISVDPSCNGDFNDLSATDWACKYAETALDNGMVAANADFRPDDLVTKIEGLKMVFQGLGLERSANSDWRAGYVDAAVEMNIATPFTDYDTAATRGELFIWAANGLDAVDVAGDLLCEILGTCIEPIDPTLPVIDPQPPIITSGDAIVSKSPESPTNGLAPVNTPRVTMLAFDVTAGNQDVTLQKATFFHVGLGNRQDVDDVTIYNSKNESVSKTKSFNDNELEVSFDRNVVVQAGTTQTFTVGATIAGSGTLNTTYQIELTDLETGGSVQGLGIVGAALTPTVASNVAELRVTEETASETIKVGEEVDLAGFTVKEVNDNEDVLIRTITLHQNGSVDAEYFDDLVLTADGQVVATNLYINGDDDLVANIDYVLGAKDDVEFKLTGVVTGDVNNTVHFEFEGSDDIYAVGMTTGFNVGFETGKAPGSSVNIADEETVEGSEIDAAWDKSDTDETRVDVDDVLVGTLELTPHSSDYGEVIVQVTVNSTAAIDDIYLDDSSYDSMSGNVYEFTDIYLDNGVTEVLPLTFDVRDDTNLNGQSVSFTIKVKSVEDEENNITYTVGGSNNINDVLSTNSFTTKRIDIETASIDIVQTRVNDRTLVLANGVETVLYKAKISVGDSDSVTIDDITLVPATGNTIGDLNDVIDDVTINIGGMTHDGDVNTNNIKFNGVNHDIAAGSDNVELLITAVLKDDASIASGSKIVLQLDKNTLSLEDSDGNDVDSANITVSNSSPTQTILIDQGVLKVYVDNSTDYRKDIDETVLGGTNGIYIAGLSVLAEYEAIDVDSLEFYIAGKDVSNNFESVSLVSSEDGTVAENAVVKFDAANNRTVIEFKNFTFPENDDTVDYALMADLAPIDNTGDADAVAAATISITVQAAADVDATGAESGEDIVADTNATASTDVAIVPVIMTIEQVSPFSEGDTSATFAVNINQGDNIFDNDDVTLTSITFSNFGDLVSEVLNIDNDDATLFSGTSTGNTITFSGDTSVQDGDEIEVRINDSGLSDGDTRLIEIARGEDNGLKYTVDSVTYDIANTSRTSLGTYKK